MFYKKYPRIDYPSLNGKKKLAVDILKRFRISTLATERIPYWEEYTLKDSDTPETLAYTLYDDINLYWLVYLVNGVVNPHEDWLMGSTKFENYIESKYNGIAVYIDKSSMAHSAGDYEVGATVNFKTTIGTDMGSSTVVDWNRTLQRLIVEHNDSLNVSVSNLGSAETRIYNKDGINLGNIIRVNDFAYDAVHRFEYIDTGDEVNPIAIDEYGISVIDNYTGLASDLSAENIKVVTIKDREAEINEAKRKIVLIRPEFVVEFLYWFDKEITKIKTLQSETYITRNRIER